ncbi:UDP-N-acetylmuramoyl-L-alanine--D-glutamate ligase [Candidatus Saccharibacteria bacterium]|nr:UDP-N-acetylmuramoyl-L-alanine--D-glutamate ligase [Candidatus Saccharibacteria bacterium]
MNILILGYGVEGKAIEEYFKNSSNSPEHVNIDILDNFNKEELLFKDFSSYDLIFRTPSIPPKFINAPEEKVTSCTKYFFHRCPCPIIGITGTKGKGTTCTFTRDIIQSIFDSKDQDVVFEVDRPKAHLVGNIGIPSIQELPNVKESDVVVYELSSFQLWDMDVSPTVSVVLRIEPDHLDVHENFEEYVSAKQNIVNYQTENNYCIYFKENEDTKKLIAPTKAQKLDYPYPEPDMLDELQVPGAHNREDAEAAILAAFAFFKLSDQKLTFEAFLKENDKAIRKALHDFKSLPHHIEFVRELNGIKYYDDSFSTVSPALRACLNSFPDTPFVLIAGGKDKGFDVSEVKRMIFDNPNLIKAVLIGETAKKLSGNEDPEKYFLAGTDFGLAIQTAKELAEAKLNQEEEISDTCLVDKKPIIKNPVVLLSPCASSFDMFKSYKDRGDQFKTLVNAL